MPENFMMTKKTKSIRELHQELLEKKISVRELCNASLQTIKEKDGDIGAFLGLYTDAFFEEQIKKAEEMFAKGVVTELTGIPFAIKDNSVVKGEIASAGCPHR